MCIHVETREQPEVSFLLDCHLACFGTGSLKGLELSEYARLDDRGAWKIFLSLLPWLWDYRHISLYQDFFNLGSEGLNPSPHA